MTLEEVKQFIEENKGDEQVQSYLQGLTTVEGVKDFTKNNPEGVRWLDSEKDKHSSKSLETWKSNNLESIIEEEVNKRNPQETPEQKRIRELEEKIAETEQAAKRDKLLNKAVSVASEKGLPTDIVSFFVGEDEDTTVQNLESFKEKYDAAIQSQIDAKFKENGRDVPGGSGDDGSTGAIFAKGANQQPKAPDNNIWE